MKNWLVKHWIAIVLWLLGSSLIFLCKSILLISEYDWSFIAVNMLFSLMCLICEIKRGELK